MTDKKILPQFILFVLAGGAWFCFRLVTGGSIVVPHVGRLLLYLLAAPLAEELFFRGVLQRELKKILKSGLPGVSYANIAVSVIFVLAHVFQWGFAHSAMVFFPSLAFGWLFDRTERVTLPFVLHIIYNLNILIT